MGIQGTEAKLMSSKNKYPHFIFSLLTDLEFHLLKVDSLNKVFYAWMKIVSQQTKQDRDLEDSYWTHFADEVLCPHSTENEIEEQCREKTISIQASFNQRGQTSHWVKPWVNKNFHLKKQFGRKNVFDFFLFPIHKIHIKGCCFRALLCFLDAQKHFFQPALASGRILFI